MIKDHRERAVQAVFHAGWAAAMQTMAAWLRHSLAEAEREGHALDEVGVDPRDLIRMAEEWAQKAPRFPMPGECPGCATKH